MSNVSNGVASDPISPLLSNHSSAAAAEVQRDGVDEEWESRAEEAVNQVHGTSGIPVDVPPPKPDLECQPCE